LNPTTNGDMAYPHYGVSPSGEFIAYQEIVRGELGPQRTGNMRVRRVANDDIYPDILQGIRNPQVAWTHDELGFFYVYHVTTRKFFQSTVYLPTESLVTT